MDKGEPCSGGLCFVAMDESLNFFQPLFLYLEMSTTTRVIDCSHCKNSQIPIFFGRAGTPVTVVIWF